VSRSFDRRFQALLDPAAAAAEPRFIPELGGEHPGEPGPPAP